MLRWLSGTSEDRNNMVYETSQPIARIRLRWPLIAEPQVNCVLTCGLRTPSGTRTTAPVVERL